MPTEKSSVVYSLVHSVPRNSLGFGHINDFEFPRRLLYKTVNGLIRDFVEEIMHAAKSKGSREVLLRFYIREWKNLTYAAKYVSRLFRYLERYWIKRLVEEGRKDVYGIYCLHLIVWRDACFETIGEEVVESVLDLIRREREDETIDLSPIETVRDSIILSKLELPFGEDEAESLCKYKLYFEDPFIKNTVDFYAEKASAELSAMSLREYIDKVGKFVGSSQQRLT